MLFLCCDTSETTTTTTATTQAHEINDGAQVEFIYLSRFRRRIPGTEDASKRSERERERKKEKVLLDVRLNASSCA